MMRKLRKKKNLDERMRKRNKVIRIRRWKEGDDK